MAEHYARTLRLTFKDDLPDDLRMFLSLTRAPNGSEYTACFEYARKFFTTVGAVVFLDCWFETSNFFPAWRTPRYKDGELLVLSAGTRPAHQRILEWLNANLQYLQLKDNQIVYRWIWEQHAYEEVVVWSEKAQSFGGLLGMSFNERNRFPTSAPHPVSYQEPIEGGPQMLDTLWAWDSHDLMKPRPFLDGWEASRRHQIAA